MGQEKRTVKSLLKTSKYHWLYVGNILAVTLGLVALLYLLLLQKVVSLTVGQEPALIKSLVGALTLSTFAVGVLVTLVALLQAHRVSGVHIKLKHTFDRVKNGDLDTQLKFRKSDHLGDVEDSFNEMMEAVRSRMLQDAATETDSKELDS
jgi:methyl-accepting chemotaxis protein